MPSYEALDSMAQKIAGCHWAELKFPEHRVQVMTLALADERNQILDAIEGHLSTNNEKLEEIDKGLTEIIEDLGHVGQWFKSSKVFTGDTYVTNIRDR